MSNYNVGVNLVEGQAVSPVAGVTTAISGIIGNFERGPIDVATLVGSMAQFTRIFGNKPATGSTAWYSVKGFFAKIGTGSLYVIRVAGSTKAKASKIFQDRQGTPANTLQVDAKNEGAWANDLSADIDDYNILSTTPASDISATATNATLTAIGGLEVGSDIKFDNGTNTEYRRIIQIDVPNKKVYWTTGLTNAYPAATSTVKSMEFSLKIYDKGLLVETHDGLSMNDSVTFYCEKKVISNYVAVTDMKATDTSYLDLPAVSSSAQALTGGNDGLTGVVKDDYVGVQANKTGKYGFDSVSNLFRFCCPNPILTDVDPVAAYKALVQDLLDYANSRNTVEFYADIPYNKSVAEAVTFAGAYEGWELNFFWPWCIAYENSQNVPIPPSSLAMGVAVEKDYRRGIHKNIGNETVPYITDLEYNLLASGPEHKTLNDAGVNVIVALAGEGIRTFGGRTRSAVTAKRYLHYAEQWMYIGRSLEFATRDIVFEPNTPATWATTIRRVTAFMLNEQRKGGVTSFVLQMDSFNNPQDQVALGIAELKVEYVPAGTIESLVIELTPSPMGLSVAA